MMDALDGARRGRRRAAPRLLPQSDRRRPRRRPVGRRSPSVVAQRGLIPFVDIAYQGLGRGLDEDARGLHLLLDACDEVDRRAKLRQEFRRLSRPRRLAVRQDRAARATATGDGPCRSRSRAKCGRCRPIMARRRCASCSRMPALRADWHAELGEMRARISRIRARIAAADPRLAYIGGQFGMFSMLPLERRAGASSCATTMRSTWPTAAASTSSAWPIDAVDRFIAAVVEAMNG